MQLSRKQRTVMVLGVAAILLIVANSLFFNFRLDLSPGGSFTISETTRKILREAKAPIQISYYLSGKLKSQYPVFQSIEDLLYEYGRASGGKASVAVINPEGRESELGLDAKGIQPSNLNTSDRTQVSQALVYSGIVVNYLDQSRAIPFIQNPAELEYELDSAIKRLERKKDLTLGILSGAPPSQGQQNDINHSYRIVRQEFGKMYSVKDVALGSEIGSDIDVLFVLNPEMLKKDSLTRVDQFIMSGKGVFMATDPVSVFLQYGLYAMPNQDAEVFRVLEAYGITAQKALLADRNNKPFPVTKQAGRLQYQQMVPYPFWIATTAEDANRSNPLTNHFAGADFFWASPLSLKAGVKGEVIVSSSPESTIVQNQPDVSPQKAPAYLAMSQEPRQARPVVVLRNGRIDSAYQADKLPLASTEQGRLIVAGNSAFVSDLLQYTGSEQNLYFLKDILEWLGNDAELMQLRNRDPGDAQLSAIKDLGTRQTVASLAWFASVVAVPLVIVVIGAVRAVKRRDSSNGKGAAA